MGGPFMLHALTLVALLALPSPVRYDGHAVVRAQPRDPTELRALQSIADVWTHRAAPGEVIARASPSALLKLRARGIPFAIVVADLQPGIDRERMRLVTGGAAGPSFYADFRDFAALDARLDELAAMAPALVEVVDVGTSIEGRPIRGVKIGAVEGGEPAAMLLSGTMHAREWISPMVTMCVAEALVVEHGVDPTVTALLESVEVFVIPVLNPDGYVWSWDVERYWRKNRRDGIGVDLNRNFPLGWGGFGSSDDPQDEDYHGEGPLSEPESAALAAFVQARPHIVTHVDFHSFGQLLLYPWSYTDELAPDHDALAMLAGTQVDAILAAGGAEYIAIKGSDLYPAAGVVDDWGYGELGIFTFATELPPPPEGPGDFVVAPEIIEPTCADQRVAVLALGQWAAQFSIPGGGSTGGDDTGAATGSDTGDPPAADGTSGSGASSDEAGSDTSAGPSAGTTGNPSATGSSEGSTGAAADGSDGDGRGCACTTRDAAPPSSWLALLVALSGLRSRSGRAGSSRARTALRRDR